MMVVPFASATHRFAVTAHAEPSTHRREERKPASVGCSVAAPSRVPHIDLWISSVQVIPVTFPSASLGAGLIAVDPDCKMPSQFWLSHNGQLVGPEQSH